MGNRLETCTLVLGTLAVFQSAALGVPPLDYFVAVTVQPSHVIEHAVEVKGPFDSQRVETLLAGPRFFCHAVGLAGAPDADQDACLNWYEIKQPTEEPRRIISVRDSLQGEESFEVAIGDAAILLSPAKRVKTGPPTDASNQLNYFKGYRALDGPHTREEVKLGLESKPDEHTVIKAVFLCVPIEQWHHHEHYPIRDKHECLMVYELLPQKQSAAVTTLDQFGLNKLEASSSRYLLAPAKIVKYGESRSEQK